MAASERIRFFTQSIEGKNKVVISETSVVALIFVKCEANLSKQICNDYMLKGLIEVSFFAIQANFYFTDTNFTKAKFCKDPLN